MDFSIEHLDHSVGWMESILSIVDQLLEGSHHAEAMFWLEQVLPSHSHSVEVLMRWAALSIELEEWETASSAYQSVLKILPTCRPALTGLLRAGAHLGDGIDHLPAFTQAFGGNSLTQYETLLVVQTLLAMRCKNEALQTLKGIGELQVEDSHAYLAYMQIANQLVQSDPCADSGQMASDIAGRVLALPVANAEIFSELLHFVARQNGPVTLINLYGELLQRCPDCEVLLSTLCKILIEQNHLEQAQIVLEATIGAQPEIRARKSIAKLGTFMAPRQRDEKLVVMMSCQPRGREMKIAGALKAEGYRTILLHKCDINYATSEFFDATIHCPTPDQALYVANKFNPLVYHVSSGKADDFSTAFMEEKPGKVVYDPYDVIDGIIKWDINSKVRRQQQFCFKHADGVCVRDLRTRHLRNRVGIELPKKTIFFTNYCRAEQCGQARSLKNISIDDMHVVVAGSITTAERKTEQDWGYLDLGRAFAENGIHCHVYPAHHQVEDPNHYHEIFWESVEFAEKSPYFHMHDPVPMEELSSELQKYHFGLQGFWSHVQDHVNPSYTVEAIEYSMSARAIDYLEAGIPIMTTRAFRAIHWMFKRYGVAIDMNREFFKNPRQHMYDFLTLPGIHNRVERAQQGYSLENHVPRLIRFSHEL